jgi:hypothetical protein
VAARGARAVPPWGGPAEASRSCAAVAGGFLSYGASVPDLFRRGASYAHKILQGTKVDQARKKRRCDLREYAA